MRAVSDQTFIMTIIQELRPPYFLIVSGKHGYKCIAVVYQIALFF